jgi:Inositol 1,3,4-trisphosphate 5/6-kinase pre-ATP-grasp domain
MSGERIVPGRAGIRIGYWLAEKKIRKLVFEEFEELCR